MCGFFVGFFVGFLVGLGGLVRRDVGLPVGAGAGVDLGFFVLVVGVCVGDLVFLVCGANVVGTLVGFFVVVVGDGVVGTTGALVNVGAGVANPVVGTCVGETVVLVVGVGAGVDEVEDGALVVVVGNGVGLGGRGFLVLVAAVGVGVRGRFVWVGTGVGLGGRGFLLGDDVSLVGRCVLVGCSVGFNLDGEGVVDGADDVDGLDDADGLADGDCAYTFVIQLAKKIKAKMIEPFF